MILSVKARRCVIYYLHTAAAACALGQLPLSERDISASPGRHDQITGKNIGLGVGGWLFHQLPVWLWQLYPSHCSDQKPDSSLFFFLYPMFKPPANLVWFDLQNKSRIWSLLIFSTANKMAQANVISRLDYYHSFLTGWIRLLQRNRTKKKCIRYIEKDVLWRLAHRVMEVTLFAVCKLETQES